MPGLKRFIRKLRNKDQRPAQVDPFVMQQRLLKGSAASEPIIFDIGANHGQTAKHYRATFPQAKIYSFEPFPEAIAGFRQKHAEDKGIKLVEAAVADQPGKRSFYVNAFDPTNSLLPRASSTRRYYAKGAGPKTTIEVDVITLNDFAAKEKVVNLSILKLDIQGGELMALKGASKLLQGGAIPLVYTEIMFVPHYEGAPLFHEVWAYLAQFGYTLFDIYDLAHASNGQLRYGDALFVSPATRAMIDSSPEEP